MDYGFYYGFFFFFPFFIDDFYFFFDFDFMRGELIVRDDLEVAVFDREALGVDRAVDGRLPAVMPEAGSVVTFGTAAGGPKTWILSCS